jgi:hypothetical protein
MHSCVFGYARHLQSCAPLPSHCPSSRNGGGSIEQTHLASSRMSYVGVLWEEAASFTCALELMLLLLLQEDGHEHVLAAPDHSWDAREAPGACCRAMA